MSSRFLHAETQRKRLSVNRETLRALQPMVRGAHGQEPSGQNCPTTKDRGDLF